MSRRKHPSRGPRQTPAAAPESAGVQASPRPAAPASRRGPWLAVLLLAVAALAGGAWWLLGPQATAPAALSADASSAVPLAPSAFVDNASCVGCHQDQARRWEGSHHAKAMAAPTEATVAGDFGGTSFTHQGVTSRFFRRDGKYVVRTDGPDGKLADFEVAFTFGVAPLQQYLIAMPGGRLQPLQIAWDLERRRWFHLLPDEKAPPGDVLHWTGRYQTANTMCISCHTTGFEKRYDATADTFASTWKEPNVSCQSCHGPGERHLGWARAQAAGVAAKASAPGERFGLDVRLKTASAAQQVEVCSACHSRRSELTATPAAGQPRLDHYLPSLLQPGLYHPDGQQLDEVFVDGSYRQSRMYGKGVRCTDCHDPHTSRLKVPGNGVCLQCHAPQADARFPTAAGNYDTPAHHHHEAGSAGAQCASCHMPAKTYMQVQPRPDHSMRVPRPDLSVKLGTPNACNACHADKTPQWAADRVAAWYGPGRRQEPHYGEVLAAARAGRPGSGESLAALIADTLNPGIVRATALAALRADGAAGMAQRVSATRDPDPEVRAAAADAFDAAPVPQRVYALAPLLRDPVRAVRIAAARALSSVPPAQLGDAHRAAFDAALAEYVAVQRVSLDMPGAHLNLAVVYQNTGRAQDAEKHYLDALRIDPDFTPARANLARLYAAASRNADAQRVLEDGLRRIPTLGDLQYALGLLLAEDGRLPQAATALARAAALLPDQARVYYNLGLAQQQLGQRPEAEKALLTAQRLDPADPAIAHALAVFYVQGGQRQQALRWAQAQLALAPDDADARRMVASLQGR